MQERKTIWKIFGHSFLERDEIRDFKLKAYPKYVQEGLKRSAVPVELYPQALAVIGRAFGNAKSLWGDRMSDHPDMGWRAPSPLDFDGVVTTLKTKVSPVDLVALSNNIFGSTNTTDALLNSIKNEIENFFKENK